MSNIVLRPYQVECVDTIYSHMRKQTSGTLICLSTGAGKSLIAAEFMRRAFDKWPASRFLITAHVKELLTQNLEALRQLCPDVTAGIYSAGLNERCTDASVIFGGIQSVYGRAPELGRFDALIVDEVHRFPKAGEGMYRSLYGSLREINPKIRVIGMSATPWRTTSGLITTGKGRIFNSIAYSATVSRLIRDGYLCRATTRIATKQINTDSVRIQGGDFVLRELGDVCEDQKLTETICDELVKAGRDRKHWLVFCSSVRHAAMVGRQLNMIGISARVVVGSTPSKERDDIIEGYKNGDFKALVNCQVLVEGFNAPATDLVALLRPTVSCGLYHQMVGRGLRLHPDKPNGCLCLDFGGNIERHGPIDEPNIRAIKNEEKKNTNIKICPECFAEQLPHRRTCEECGHEFPVKPSGSKLARIPAGGELISGDDENAVQSVTKISYHRHEKPGKPPSMRVDYYAGFNRVASEWICFEHGGYAADKAYTWWMARDPDGFPPVTTDAALQNTHLLREPVGIVTRPDGEFRRIVRYVWPSSREGFSQADLSPSLPC